MPHCCHQRCRCGRNAPLPTRKGHEPTPYCTGVGCRKDFHEHPATFMGGSTSAIQERWGCLPSGHPDFLGNVERSTPERDFPIGSEWHYGPVYENMETRVRVVGRPYQQGGSRPLRDQSWKVPAAPGAKPRARGARLTHDGRHILHDGPRSWFVPCVVVSSPFHDPGEQINLPPCALIPAEYVDAERGIRSNCGCCGASLCAASLRTLPWCCQSDPRDEQIEELRQEVAGLRSRLRTAERRRLDAESRERALRTKVTEALG